MEQMMNKENEKQETKVEQIQPQLTTKEQYDVEMAGINKANAEKIGVDLEQKQEDEAVAEDVMQDLEDQEDSKALDKSMGSEKEPVGPGPFSKAVDSAKGINPPPKTHTMTLEQFHKMKEARLAQEALQSLRDTTASNLPMKDQKILNLVLAQSEAGEVKDEVLVALLEEKNVTARLIVKAMTAIAQLQKKLLNDVAAASNNLVKARGAMEGIDHMILKRKKKMDASKEAPAKENMN